MNIKALLTIILLTLTTLSGKWDLEEEDGIPFLTSANFDSFIESNPLVFVKFYAPWCGHCKKMIPAYKSLAERMAEENHVPIVKVDATKEKDIIARYNVKGYPSLKLFKNGHVIDYKGGREEDDIYKFINKKTSDSAKELKTEEEIDEFGKSSVAVLYIVPNGDGDTVGDFKAVAENMEDVPFAYTYNTNYAKKLQLDDEHNLVVFRDFDDGNKSLSSAEPLPKQRMTYFVESVRFPLVMEFDDKVAKKIFGEKKPAVFLFTDDFSIEQAALFRQVAEERKGQIYFSISKISSGIGSKLANMLDIKKTEEPTIRIVRVAKAGVEKYKVDDSSMNGIKQALDDFKAKKLSPYYKSASPPQNNDKPVKVIVGTTFEEQVINSGKFVLVEAYAPWCGHCKKLDPIYNDLAEKLAEHDDIVLAKMDATENEYKGFDVKGYPTIALFKPGQSNPSYYNKERSYDMLLIFLEEHIGRKLIDEVSTDL